MNGKELETRSERERFWRRLFRSHSEGNVTVRELCEKHGVSIPSYYQWKRKLAKSPAVESSLPFAELRVVPEQGAGFPDAIEVILETGRTMRVTPGFDEQTLLRLMALLESDRC